ncbi:hypothetical protein CJD36_022380 [Flavipsychrobacter stenotrophus]|uniref:Type I restriction modification DNA specificity domain-containing protein n=1 Tax=Flavipsychrobacter stenotrophus TaxID=2077091 RepID=A0A2S7SPI1_9BACT|nr:restriction endonuclease subunit S [Flavipsychrobacter stenotrophus]PQJ08803.1 hypothetical protein CJD36_022380 [Flavipsychrobacter stenotrophus]
MATKKQKISNVPNLRFPGFEGEWRRKRLGEVGEIISGLTYSPNDIADDGVLVLRSSNVQRRRLAFVDNVFVKTGNFNPALEDDILICVRNGSQNLIGKNALIKKEHEGLAFGAFMTIYRSSYNHFLFHWFDTEEYKSEVYKNLGATINSINGSDLKRFKVPFPSDTEQKKIASFLSILDERIATQNKIIEQLKSLIKKLGEEIFSQKLRFPGFQDRWSKTTVNEQCQINPKTEPVISEFVYIDLESVVKGELIREVIVQKADAPSRATRVLEDGDVLFQCVRPYQLNNYIYRRKDDRQWVASTGYA